MSELYAFPRELTNQLLEKVNYLVEDPVPDGHLKKKLRAGDGICRLRVGRFRIFYTFGESWVCLLGIRRRSERTYKDKFAQLVADEPLEHDDTDVADLDDALAEEEAQQTRTSMRQWRFDGTPQPLSSAPLSRPLTVEWLTELRVAPQHLPALLACETEDDLLNAAVPESLLERVIDNLAPRPLTEVEQQPDFIVRDAADLVRYKEGDLVAFLLKLDEDQERLTTWAIKGPTMVKGGAGTGKSTVALHRIRVLLEQAEATGSERALFATYTNALVEASRQLIGQLLAPEQHGRVEVSTCDRVAYRIVAAQRSIGEVENSGRRAAVFRDVRGRFEPSGPSGWQRKLRKRALDRMSDAYLLEEFEWIIDGRGLSSLDEYRDAPRPGRGYPLQGTAREVVWELYEALVGELRRRGIERFADLRSEALELVRNGTWQGRYDYVIVDEAQDLTPVSLALMAELARTAEGLFFAADTKQSLYSRNYTWSATHPRLQFRGRTSILRRNYRSTHELDRAAFAVLRPEDGEALETSESVRNGPLPVAVREVAAEAEAEWIARYLQQMARHLRLKASAAAVLVPEAAIGARVARSLSEAGLPARFFKGREIDLRADEVKVLTLHSAKGLEFPVVVVAGFEPGTYPALDEFAEATVYEERLRNARRLLYVGMTRAMRGLMVVVPRDCVFEPLGELSSDFWHIERAAS